ncbi:MAG: hypothetical protein WBD45_04945 [Terriglobales bacterium]
MKWLFVSRERFEQQREELLEARAQLAKLNNWIVFRMGGGMAPDPSLLAEAYQPRTSQAPQNAGAAPDDEEQKRKARGPANARRTLGQFERDRQIEYEHQTMIPNGQLGVAARLNNAANEGMKDASN